MILQIFATYTRFWTLLCAISRFFGLDYFSMCFHSTRLEQFQSLHTRIERNNWFGISDFFWSSERSVWVFCSRFQFTQHSQSIRLDWYNLFSFFLSTWHGEQQKCTELKHTPSALNMRRFISSVSICCDLWTTDCTDKQDPLNQWRADIRRVSQRFVCVRKIFHVNWVDILHSRRNTLWTEQKQNCKWFY